MGVLSVINRFFSGLIFRKIDLDERKEFFRFKHEARHFSDLDTSFLRGKVRKDFEIYNRDNKNVEYEFVYKGKSFIEPQFGWIIIKRNKYLLQSFSNAKDFPGPSVFRLLIPPLKKKVYNKAVSIQYRWDNYYHFYNDVLPQLAMMERTGIGSDIPIIIPRGALSRSYVKQAFELSPFLQSRNWVELNYRQKIVVRNEIIVFKNYTFIASALLNAITFFNLPVAVNAEDTKIFLRRNTNRPRSLKNSAEIEAIAQKQGFKIIDNDQLSLREQIDIFSKARYVCGIHGAGLTNLIFRYKWDCSLMEIFPENYIMPTYYWLACSMHIAYRALVGSKEDKKYRTFKVSPTEFENSLKEFLSQT